MKSMIKLLVKNLLIIFSIYSGLIFGQQAGYNKQIEQWDDELYTVTLTDSQGNFKSVEMCYTDPEFFNLVFNESNPIDPIGPDLLNATLYMPDNARGVKPYDNCYNANYNKIYVYGNQKLLVFNATTKQIITSIRVSDVGDLSTASNTLFPKTKCLTYDYIHNKLYCATIGKELVVVDGISDQIITTYTMTENVNQLTPFVIFNEQANKIYWINNFWFQGARVWVIDASTGTYNNMFFNEGYIYDLEINSSGSVCYAGMGNELKFLNASNFSIIQTVPTGIVYELVYSSASNKIYGSKSMTDQLAVVNASTGFQYPDLTLPVSSILNGCVNSTNDKVYFTSGNEPYYNNKLTGINCSNNQILFSYYIYGAQSLIYNSSVNKVYCGGLNVVKTIDGATNSISNTSTIDGCRSHALSIGYNNELVSIEHFEHTISYFNSSGDHIITDDVGGATHIGCYNTNNNKVYYIKEYSNHDNSYISIWDGLTNNHITKIAVGEYITDVVYNAASNKVFVSSESSSIIKVIDGTTNQVIQTLGGVAGRHLFSFENKIYCMSGSTIKIINVENYQITNINCLGSSRWSAIDYGQNNKVFLASAQGNIIYVIDYNSNSVVYEITTNSSPLAITFNSSNQKVYTSNEDGTISVYDANNYQLITNIQVTDFTAGSPIVYGTYSNTIYVCGWNNSLAKQQITLINGVSNTVTGKILPDGNVSGMFYNPTNNTLYVHLLYSGDNLKMVIKGYDCTENKLIQLIETGNKQRPGFIGYFTDDQQIVSNETNNKLYAAGLGFANIAAVQIGQDILGLNFGWCWISFPRMERYAFADDPVHPVPIMKNATYYPSLYFTLWSQNPMYKKIYNPNMPDPWSGLLIEVRSTLGYKYEAPPADLPQPKQTLTGARLYPECPVGLPVPGAEKWIGYFIEKSQYPWDAFPAAIYNGPGGLTRIQAQYWTMDKITSPGGGWGWVISGKVTPIKYGDMVIIRYTGPLNSFIWNNPDASEEEKTVPKPQAYSWEEKADYVPFYIETDSTSDIIEIAVMVNGECMGATVREPGDTLVEVDGYLGELPIGAVVEFETWNGLKSAPVERNGYVVYDPSMHKREKRNIYVGEKQDYYMVSFKAGEVYEIPDDISQITCGPNPFRDETILTMRLNNEQHIEVEVFNIQGVKIKTLLNSDLPGGYYEVIWNGDNESGNKVKEGVYFYRIKTGNGTIVTDKIILIK